jgi:hypothetical protein
MNCFRQRAFHIHALESIHQNRLSWRGFCCLRTCVAGRLCRMMSGGNSQRHCGAIRDDFTPPALPLRHRQRLLFLGVGNQLTTIPA